VPNIDLPAMCSPCFKPGPPGEEAQVPSDRLNNVLIVRDLEVLSTASLCIHAGKAVWVLHVVATCLLAMTAALKNTKLLMAKFNEETGRTTCSHSSSVPLDIRHLPLSASFGIFDSSHILADPASFQEPLLDAFITVILNEDGALNSIAQSGLPTVGKNSSEEVVAGCVAEAKKRCADTRKCI
ncbi:hypothetical protein JB92DRAFT_2732598, partial [Gautieria morchelliformis]